MFFEGKRELKGLTYVLNQNQLIEYKGWYERKVVTPNTGHLCEESHLILENSGKTNYLYHGLKPKEICHNTTTMMNHTQRRGLTVKSWEKLLVLPLFFINRCDSIHQICFSLPC